MESNNNVENLHRAKLLQKIQSVSCAMPRLEKVRINTGQEFLKNSELLGKLQPILIEHGVFYDVLVEVDVSENIQNFGFSLDIIDLETGFLMNTGTFKFALANSVCEKKGEELKTMQDLQKVITYGTKSVLIQGFRISADSESIEESQKKDAVSNVYVIEDQCFG